MTLWTGVLLMIPGLAQAGEIELGGSAEGGWDSNVFRRSGSDERDSGVLKLGLHGAVQDELERGSYGLSYDPTFFYNAAPGVKNQWNQRARADGVYRFSPRTSVSLSDDFAFLEKPVFPADGPDGDPSTDDENKRTISNAVNLGLQHYWQPRLSSYAGANYTVYRFDRARDEDNDSMGGWTGLNYALDKTVTVGGGGQFNYRSFDSDQDFQSCGGQNGPGSHSIAYSGYASIAYQYDEHTSARIQAGPARIESTSFVCQIPATGFYLQQEVDSNTWFAEGELSRRWEHVKTVVRYRRSEGFGGVGTTTVNDQVTARLSWQPARLWNLNLRAGWIFRDQDSPSGVRETDTTTWTAAASASRQFLKRLRASVDVSYRNQDADQKGSGTTRGRPGDFDVWRVFAGFTYQYDPIRY